MAYLLGAGHPVADRGTATPNRAIERLEVVLNDLVATC
jgi:hypothetical protein